MVKTSWNFFVQEEGRKYMQEHPDLSYKEVIQAMSKRWNKMTTEEKKVYIDLSIEFNEQFPDAKIKHVSGYTIFSREYYEKIKGDFEDPSPNKPEIIRAISKEWHSLSEKDKNEYGMKAIEYKQEKGEEFEAKIKKEKKDKKKDGKPKRITAYNLYVKENREKIANENKDKANGEIIKIIADKWNKLDEKTKIEYMEKSAKINSENFETPEETEFKIINLEKPEISLIDQYFTDAKFASMINDIIEAKSIVTSLSPNAFAFLDEIIGRTTPVTDKKTFVLKLLQKYPILKEKTGEHLMAKIEYAIVKAKYIDKDVIKEILDEIKVKKDEYKLQSQIKRKIKKEQKEEAKRLAKEAETESDNPEEEEEIEF